MFDFVRNYKTSLQSGYTIYTPFNNGGEFKLLCILVYTWYSQVLSLAILEIGV